VTGASTGIGFDLARECAEHDGSDAMMAAQGDTLRLSQREWQLNAGSRSI
jgi:short-subunit dehydrogenase